MFDEDIVNYQQLFTLDNTISIRAIRVIYWNCYPTKFSTHYTVLQVPENTPESNTNPTGVRRVNIGLRVFMNFITALTWFWTDVILDEVFSAVD